MSECKLMLRMGELKRRQMADPKNPAVFTKISHNADARKSAVSQRLREVIGELTNKHEDRVPWGPWGELMITNESRTKYWPPGVEHLSGPHPYSRIDRGPNGLKLVNACYGIGQEAITIVPWTEDETKYVRKVLAEGNTKADPEHEKIVLISDTQDAPLLTIGDVMKLCAARAKASAKRKKKDTEKALNAMLDSEEDNEKSGSKSKPAGHSKGTKRAADTASMVEHGQRGKKHKKVISRPIIDELDTDDPENGEVKGSDTPSDRETPKSPAESTVCFLPSHYRPLELSQQRSLGPQDKGAHRQMGTAAANPVQTSLQSGSRTYNAPLLQYNSFSQGPTTQPWARPTMYGGGGGGGRVSPAMIANSPVLAQSVPNIYPPSPASQTTALLPQYQMAPHSLQMLQQPLHQLSPQIFQQTQGPPLLPSPAGFAYSCPPSRGSQHTATPEPLPPATGIPLADLQHLNVTEEQAAGLMNLMWERRAGAVQQTSRGQWGGQQQGQWGVQHGGQWGQWQEGQAGPSRWHSDMGTIPE